MLPDQSQSSKSPRCHVVFVEPEDKWKISTEESSKAGQLTRGAGKGIRKPRRLLKNKAVEPECQLQQSRKEPKSKRMISLAKSRTKNNEDFTCQNLKKTEVTYRETRSFGSSQKCLKIQGLTREQAELMEESEFRGRAATSETPTGWQNIGNPQGNCNSTNRRKTHISEKRSQIGDTLDNMLPATKFSKSQDVRRDPQTPVTAPEHSLEIQSLEIQQMELLSDYNFAYLMQMSDYLNIPPPTSFSLDTPATELPMAEYQPDTLHEIQSHLMEESLFPQLQGAVEPEMEEIPLERLFPQTKGAEEPEMEEIPLEIPAAYRIRNSCNGQDNTSTSFCNSLSQETCILPPILELHSSTPIVSTTSRNAKKILESTTDKEFQCRFTLSQPAEGLKAFRYVAGLSRDQLLNADEEGDTILHLAIIKEELSLVNALIIRYDRDQLTSHVINVRNSSDQTPLCMAVYSNQPEVVSILIARGADANVQVNNSTASGTGSKHYRPLHYASSRGKDWSQTLCEIMKANDIELDAFNSEGRSPLHVAIEAHGKSNSKRQSIDSRHIIHDLVARGADINIQDGGSGRTPLHYVIEKKNYDFLNWFLQMVSSFQIVGPSAKCPSFQEIINTRTTSGSSSLHIASSLALDQKDKEKILELLVRSGAQLPNSGKNMDKNILKSVMKIPHIDDPLRSSTPMAPAYPLRS